VDISDIITVHGKAHVSVFAGAPSPSTPQFGRHFIKALTLMQKVKGVAPTGAAQLITENPS